jgi:flagellar motor protein MotB
MALPEEPEKPPNHERWIISYADFMTLLLATFVVMYAVSSINSSKFQEMAEAFNTAFMGKTVEIQSTGFAAGQKSPFNFMPSPVHVPIITRDVVPDKNLPVTAVQNQPERAKPMGRMEDTPNAPFAPPPAGTPDQKATEPQQTAPAPPAVVAVLEPAVPPPGGGQVQGAQGGGGTGDKSAYPNPPGWTIRAQPPTEESGQGRGPGQAEGQAQGGQAQDLGQGPPVAPELKKEIEQRAALLDQAYNQLKQALSPLIGTGEVRVSLSSLGVVIDINEVLLFNSGKAELTPQALPLIDKIAGILKGLPYQIQVNGFTDTVPIHTAQFDSNWDLSATRAISVVKRFVTAGLDPTKLVGAGFGEYHPVASNATVEGKAQNRRVSVVVVSPMQGGNPMKTPMLGTPQSRIANSPVIAPAALPSVP